MYQMLQWSNNSFRAVQRLKITILCANWQLFRLERIAKCYFVYVHKHQVLLICILKIKKLLLPIWWYNRGLFPLGNKIFWVLRAEWVNTAPRPEEQISPIRLKTRGACSPFAITSQRANAKKRELGSGELSFCYSYQISKLHIIEIRLHST